MAIACNTVEHLLSSELDMSFNQKTKTATDLVIALSSYRTAPAPAA